MVEDQISPHPARSEEIPTTPPLGAEVAGRAMGRRRGDRLIIASGSLQQSVDLASSLARSGLAVLIEGPVGSGRSHLARAMHGWSQAAGGPMVRFSPTGLSAEDQETELFGSDGIRVSGAMAQSAGGTLLVSEIGSLAPALLSRLRSTLEKEATEPETAATHRLIATGVSGTGEALADWRLRCVQVSSLDDRKEDILPLAAHFLAQFAEDQGVSVVGFAPDARRWLVEDSWPGNVRELRERIRQAVRLSGTGAVSAEALMLSAEGQEVPSFKEAKRAFETRYVESLLRRCGGNISRAARLARKDRKDFYDVIRRTGVDPARFRG